MSPRQKYVYLHHSERRHPGARRQRQPPDSEQIIRATAVVSSRATPEARAAAVRALALQPPEQRRHLGLEQFARLYGARREDLSQVESFAKEWGLQVVEASLARRCVVLSGTLATFSRAFRVEFAIYDDSLDRYRSYTGPIQVPAHLAGVIEAVFGFDDRPWMNHNLFAAPTHDAARTECREVMEVYQFPTGVAVKGQCIAIIELGGGFHRRDLKAYFEKHRLPAPRLSIVEIDGQKNDPAPAPLTQDLLGVMGLLPADRRPAAVRASRLSARNPNPALLARSREEALHALWTIETTLDLQLAASFAPGARIVVYFAPNTLHGKYHALTAALTSRQHPATVISGSWGALENSLPRDFIHCLDQVLQDAALRGISVCFSSGDSGDGSGQGQAPSVQFPASSPHVLACGGTHWVRSKGGIKEVVWDEPLPTRRCQSGGGVSQVFARPEWQYSAAVELKTGAAGRGVPDVSGKADIAHGYSMVVGGREVTMGGTSAVAPLWAGLIARLNQALGCRVGYLTPFLYQDLCREALRDVTEGVNGDHFRAGKGWDPCTGLGTPDGKRLLAALRGK